MTVAHLHTAERASHNNAPHAPPAVKIARSREQWLRELEALLRVYEPARVHRANELLAAYEGLERELVQCYRHFYTGEGGFTIATPDAAAPGPTFSLPREAIDTYLRLKLRARRSRSFASKGDDMRGAEVVASAASPVSATRTAQPATRATARQRAASTSAVRMHL